MGMHCLFQFLLVPILMRVSFREFDSFNVWIWLEFITVPSEMEKQYLEEVFNSWFFLGKLGGFNAENLQVQEVGLEISHMDYDQDMADDSMQALMHNMGDVEYEGIWARCWFDLGTSDAIAVDVLVNSLRQFSKDYVTLEQVILGGENEDWRTETDRQRSDIYADRENN
jgi:Protein of unknown function (DUF3531)